MDTRLNFISKTQRRKGTIACLFLFFLFSVSAFNQGITITGTITDTDSIPLPGVTVLVPGTTVGVVSNLDGHYSINIPVGADSIEFRFVGMATRKLAIDNQSTINVQLQKELYQMTEVVVTALGITRDKKAVGYSVTSIGDDELKKAAGRSPITSLQGKIAGVSISSSSGAPGASTRVLVRGVTTLSGSNQPLYIIDGVPVTNNSSGSSSINGGTDFGNAMNDINPDDIESINFLKGASATALYGSRASNGVIVIRTKKGTNNEKTKISISSSVGFESPLRLVEYQNEFGQGIYGESVLYENMSWGPRFDNKYHAWGNEVDGSVRIKPYSALEDNVEEFFDVGISTTNSMSVSGGNELTTYYFSYSNTYSDGIFPTNSDSYKKNFLSMRGSRAITKWMKITSTINYINKTSSFVSTGQGEQSVYNQIMQTPRDISLLELSDINSEWNNLDNYYSLYTLNPYFILENNGNKNQESKTYGTIALNINPFKGLNLDMRYGGDYLAQNIKEWEDVAIPEGNNENSAVYSAGSVSISSYTRTQNNADAILSYQNNIKKIDYSLRAGTSLNQRTSEGVTTSVNSLVISGLYSLSNSSEQPSSSESYVQIRNQGVFSNLDLSYDKWINISVSGRNEWSSTLPVKNNSYFFPGVSGSFILSDLVPKIKKHVPLLKLRGSWAIVGNDAPAYAYNSYYVQSAHSDGYSSFSYPFNNINSYEVGNMISNEDLRPEMTEEIELGCDFRIFNNRVGFDFAWYDKTTTDLIWAVPVSGSSGYTYQTMNIGEVNNTGIELKVDFALVKRENFDWNVSFNFTRNENLLVSLNDNLEKVVLNSIGVDGGQQINWLAVEGYPIGVYEARTALYTDDGKLVVDENGLPVVSDDLTYYGNSQYKYYGGGSSEFRIKNVFFSFLIDYRIGGIMYSRTKDICLWAGTSTQTLYNDREPFIIPNSVIEVGTDDNGDPIYVENSVIIDDNTLVEYWGNGGVEIDGASLVSKSFVKLREMALTWNLPEHALKRLKIDNISLSVIGNNLLLWTPEDQNFIDPESTTFGSDIGADFGEYGAQPSVRSVTFNLRFDF